MPSREITVVVEKRVSDGTAIGSWIPISEIKTTAEETNKRFKINDLRFGTEQLIFDKQTGKQISDTRHRSRSHYRHRVKLGETYVNAN